MGTTETGLQLEWRVTKPCTGDLLWAKGRRPGMRPCRRWMGGSREGLDGLARRRQDPGFPAPAA